MSISTPRLLLICGAVATVLFIGTDIAAATFFYPGYDYTAQQVSELSAIGAPSRAFWIALSVPYALLMAAFAAGVWMAAGPSRSLRIAAVLIGLFAANGLPWVVLAPMHMRATQFETTDVAHIAFAAAAVLLMLFFIIFGAIALGRSFRIYSAVTLIAMLAAGYAASTQISAIAAGHPTPWMGLVERIAVHGPMVWIAVFALALLHRETSSAPIGSKT